MLTTYAFQLKLNLNSFYYLLLIIVMHKVSRSRHLFVLKNMNLRKGVSVVFDVLCICILIWKENCYMFIIVIAMNYPNFSAWNMWSNQPAPSNSGLVQHPLCLLTGFNMSISGIDDNEIIWSTSFQYYRYINYSKRFRDSHGIYRQNL